MKIVKAWTRIETTPTGIDLRVEGGHILSVMVLEDRLFRVLMRRGGALRLGRTWCVAPNGPEPIEGRDRLSVAGFACPPFQVRDGDGWVALETGDLRVTVTAPLQLVWEARVGDAWRPLAADRPTGAYMIGVRDHRHGHFLRRNPGERIFGLGEKTGDLERTGRRFEMRNLDAMGYDAETTDPLYKHVPFTLTRTRESGTRTPDAGWYSIFYDNMACCWFDLGNEIDNYHPPYRAYRAEDGDLDYYFRWAPEPEELVRRQTALTGGVAFGPKWSLGYSGSTMQYTDAPDAQNRLEGFVRLCAEHDIPCDSFQLSSGYTAIESKRYVFNWNRDRVPDPAGMAATFAEAGMHLAANIKPCLLHDHPLYAEARDAGLFIRDDETGDPERSPFWDDEGSHLDFTNPATIRWWQANVTENLLDVGIEATWNDNNEFPVWNGAAQCHGFADPVDIALMRPVQALLMMRASDGAQRAHAPDKRPYLISRSGPSGLQAWVQTWTGDNRTEWKTLRYNIRMGLGLALSGISNVGHDVGGFAGPKPTAEMFLRWVQNGALHPRFTIHSWNDDGSVTEPWSFPEVLDAVRAAIALRYRLLPYLYTLLWEAHTDHAPMIRPAFLTFPDDAGLLAESDDFMLGPDLLVAPVVDPGVRERSVRLPAHDGGWYDWHEGRLHAGGDAVHLDAPLDRCPILVRGGSVVVTDGPTDGPVDARRLLVYPFARAGQRAFRVYDDDGDTADWRASHLLVSGTLICRDGAIEIEIAASGDWRPAYRTLEIVLPEGESRPLRVNGQPVSSGHHVEVEALF